MADRIRPVRQFIGTDEVRRQLGGISKTSLYFLHRDNPHFPKAVKIGRRSFWDQADIEAFKAALLARRGA